MKKANYGRLKAGDLVQVPWTQFSEQRRGWNGWLFNEAVVIKKGIAKESGRRVVVVEVCLPRKKGEYTTTIRTFKAEYVFETWAAESSKKWLAGFGVESREDFERFIQRDDVSGCQEIRFLIDKGFIFGEEATV